MGIVLSFELATISGPFKTPCRKILLIDPESADSEFGPVEVTVWGATAEEEPVMGNVWGMTHASANKAAGAAYRLSTRQLTAINTNVNPSSHPTATRLASWFTGWRAANLAGLDIGQM